MREKRWTHTLEDKNGVSSIINCEKREGPTAWRTEKSMSSGRKGTHVLRDQNGVSSGFERKEREIRTD